MREMSSIKTKLSRIVSLISSYEKKKYIIKKEVYGNSP